MGKGWARAFSVFSDYFDSQIVTVTTKMQLLHFASASSVLAVNSPPAALPGVPSPVHQQDEQRGPIPGAGSYKRAGPGPGSTTSLLLRSSRRSPRSHRLPCLACAPRGTRAKPASAPLLPSPRTPAAPASAQGPCPKAQPAARLATGGLPQGLEAGASTVSGDAGGSRWLQEVVASTDLQLEAPGRPVVLAAQLLVPSGSVVPWAALRSLLSLPGASKPSPSTRAC